MASPRLISVPDSPPLPAQLPPNSEVEDTGPALSSSDRSCAPSQFPVTDTANYEQLSYRQLHELCEQRGYQGKNTKAVLRTRLAAMDAARKKPADGGLKDMDTPTMVLGRRTRTMEDTMDTSMAVGGYTDARP